MTWHSSAHVAQAHPADGSIMTKIQQSQDMLEDTVGSDDVCFLWTGGKEANVIADMLLYDIGRSGRAPVPFVTVDTGNAYDEMYTFRERYVSATGDRGAETVGPFNGIQRHSVVSADTLIDEVIQNDDDPRGYHGRWDATVELPDEDPVDGLPRSPAEWDVPASCGMLKVVPIRQLVTEHGFDTLITGRRGEDPLTPGDDDTLSMVREKSKPAPHTRINPLAGWGEEDVYSYIKKESVPLPDLYTEQNYRHTDTKCCTDDEQVSEYGEGGRDPEKQQAQDRLEEMGYV